MYLLILLNVKISRKLAFKFKHNINIEESLFISYITRCSIETVLRFHCTAFVTCDKVYASRETCLHKSPNVNLLCLEDQTFSDIQSLMAFRCNIIAYNINTHCISAS